MSFKRKILITGGAGFIGSHLVRHLVNKYSDYLIINFDSLTYAGNLYNLQDIDFLFSTRGPGNFNGIRIALSFARGLALGNSLKAAGLSTLECLARSINTNKNVGVILKAFPEHFYFQLFDKNYIALRKPELININEELNIVLKKDNCIIVGNECNQFAAKIGFAGKVIHLDNPLSSGLMKSALHYLKIKKFQSPDPLYLRPANVSEPIHWKNSPVIE